MKAISIREPWASLILQRKKTIETRVWQTKYRGPLLLCASKRPESNISGKAFALCILKDIKPMTKEDEKKACCEVYEGAYSWFLEKIQPIESIDQFTIQGQLRLFEVKVNAQINIKGEKDGIMENI